MKSTQTLTRADVLALHERQTMTDVDNLARAIGAGRNGVYQAIADGTWTATRVLRLGRRILIPTADILALVEGSSTGPTAA